MKFDYQCYGRGYVVTYVFSTHLHRLLLIKDLVKGSSPQKFYMTYKIDCQQHLKLNKSIVNHCNYTLLEFQVSNNKVRIGLIRATITSRAMI